MHGLNAGIGAREELTVRLGVMQKMIMKVPFEGKIVEKKGVAGGIWRSEKSAGVEESGYMGENLFAPWKTQGGVSVPKPLRASW